MQEKEDLNLKKWIVLIAVTAVTIGMVLAVLSSGAPVSSANIPSSGVLATGTLRVYSDSACTQSLSSINWGNVTAGNSVTEIIYIKNVGNTQLTLNLTSTNWNPTTANGPLTLSWNREGATLAANQVTNATLTLSILSTISGVTTFSVNIIINGNS